MAFDFLKSTIDFLSVENKKRPVDKSAHEKLNAVLSFILLTIVIGAVIVYLADVGSIATALLWSGAFFVVGWIIGFLFGIPRTVQHNATGQPATSGGVEQQPNTNLEQISDWLTKILVGLGLTQLSKIPSLVRWLSNFVGSGIIGKASTTAGTPLYASAFAAGIFLYFTGVGFIGGYLLTKLILAGLFLHYELIALVPADPIAVTPATIPQKTATDVVISSAAGQNPTKSADLTVTPATIPQKRATDVVISSTKVNLTAAKVTSPNETVIIGSPSANTSNASQVAVSITVPGQGDFPLVVHPVNSAGTVAPGIPTKISGT